MSFGNFYGVQRVKAEACGIGQPLLQCEGANVMVDQAGKWTSAVFMIFKTKVASAASKMTR